jgi:ATP/maltotriose-dependent transcriptional regulator MalT
VVYRLPNDLASSRSTAVAIALLSKAVDQPSLIVPPETSSFVRGQDDSFVGRELELEALASYAAAAIVGESRVAWVEGDPGSGKTALVHQAMTHLSPSIQVLRAVSDELAVDVPFAVVDQLAPVRDRNPFSAGLHLLDHLAGLESAGPVVLLVEDLHWADALSRQALLVMAQRLDGDRVFVIVTSRPGGAPDGWERFRLSSDRCASVTVGPFSVDEVSTLADRLGAALTPKHADRLHRHTKGHPLYTRALLVELTPAQLASNDELHVPRTLAATMLATLSQLPGPARDLASALAVVNQRIPLSKIGRIAGTIDAAEALEHLLPTGFVVWSPREPGTPVELAHPLFRIAIYDDLSPTRRRQLHRAAAELVDAKAALSHRLAAADGPDDRLANELVEAALRQARAAPGLAATYRLWASELYSNRDVRGHQLIEAVHLLLVDHQVTRAASFWAPVEASPASLNRSLVLGLLAWMQGDASTAERWLRDVVDSVSDDESETTFLAEALTQLAVIHYTGGDGERAVAAASAALRLSHLDPERERLAWSSLALGEGMRRGAPAGLDRLSERVPEGPAAVPAADVALLVTRGTLGFYASHTTAAVADLRAAIGRVRDTVPVPQLPRAHIHLAQLLVHQGDWDQALLHARVALSLVSDEGHLWIKAQAHSASGTILASRGDWEAASAHAESAHQAADLLGTSEAVFTALSLDASIARARGNATGVVDALGPLASHPTRIPMLSSLAWWSVLVEAIIGTGDLDRAQEQLDFLIAGTEARRLEFRSRITGHRARLAHANGDVTTAAVGFEQAIEQMGPDDPVLDRGLIYLDFGRLLRSAGDRNRALDQLRTAHELLKPTGAAPFQKQIEAELSACGIRGAGRTSRGSRSSLALSERQQDVAVLVARGLTNREIGTELYMSEKSVEYHLSHVFGKLGLRSRRELRDHPAVSPDLRNSTP